MPDQLAGRPIEVDPF
jgi:hypothetical protein